MAHAVFKYRKGEAYPWVYKYPQTALTADCIVFSFSQDSKQKPAASSNESAACKKDSCEQGSKSVSCGKESPLKVLLIKRGSDPYKGYWAFPGGFVNPDETAEQGAVRELQEETGLQAPYLEQFEVFSTPNRDPRQRVVTVPFFVLTTEMNAVAADDAAEAQWFPVDDLPSLAFDHKEIFEKAMASLRKSLVFNPLWRFLLPEEFTMSQLQALYEAIYCKKYDRRNFARKMLSTGHLNDGGLNRQGLPSRKATIYTFKENSGGCTLRTNNSKFVLADFEQITNSL